MVLTAEQRAERRREGVRQMSFIRKIHRSLVNGRPPASEFKTPLAAVTAAQALYSDIERKLTAEGWKPERGELGVFVGYVPPDLSFLGHTQLYFPGQEKVLMESLNGNILLGLLFGILDPEAESEEDRFAVGVRPFIQMKQVDEWLSGLVPIMRMEMGDMILDRKIEEQKGS